MVPSGQKHPSLQTSVITSSAVSQVALCPQKLGTSGGIQMIGLVVGTTTGVVVGNFGVVETPAFGVVSADVDVVVVSGGETGPTTVVDSTPPVVVIPLFGVVVPGGETGPPTVVDSSPPVVVIPLFGVVVVSTGDPEEVVVYPGIVVVSTFGPVVGPTAHPLKSTCILIGVLSSDTTG